ATCTACVSSCLPGCRAGWAASRPSPPAGLELLSNGIDAREHLVRERMRHDHGRRRARHVAIVECTPAQDRNADGAEVVAGDDAVLDVRMDVSTPGQRPTERLDTPRIELSG